MPKYTQKACGHGVFEKPARICARFTSGALEHTHTQHSQSMLRDGHLGSDATVNYYNLIGATQWEIITARTQSMDWRG